MDMTYGKSVGGEAPSAPLDFVEKLPAIDMTNQKVHMHLWPRGCHFGGPSAGVVYKYDRRW